MIPSVTSRQVIAAHSCMLVLKNILEQKLNRLKQAEEGLEHISNSDQLWECVMDVYGDIISPIHGDEYEHLREKIRALTLAVTGQVE